MVQQQALAAAPALAPASVASRHGGPDDATVQATTPQLTPLDGNPSAPQDAADAPDPGADQAQAEESVAEETDPELDAAPQPLPGISRADPSPAGSRGVALGPVILVAAAAGAGLWLLRRLRRSGSSSNRSKAGQAHATSASGRPRSSRQKRTKAGAVAPAEPEAPPAPPPEPIDPDGLAVLVCAAPAGLPGAAAPAIPGLPPPLSGVRCCISEDMDLAGTATTLGAPGADIHVGVSATAPALPAADAEAGGSGSATPAPTSAAAVASVLGAGTVCVGKASMQPLGLDLVGANVGNPYNRSRVAGGGQTGSAMAVATGLADVALCTDVAGSARVPAAVCGLYCYSATPGALGPANAAAGGAAGAVPVESVSVMAKDPNVVLRAAQAMGAPGNPNLRGEILKFVVAEDLFSLCEVEYQPGSLAIKKAILKWAGSEQAGAVQLCRFLADNTGCWREVQVSEEYASLVDALPPALGNWATAACVLRDAHLNASLPSVAAARAVEAASATATAEGPGSAAAAVPEDGSNATTASTTDEAAAAAVAVANGDAAAATSQRENSSQEQQQGEKAGAGGENGTAAAPSLEQPAPSAADAAPSSAPAALPLPAAPSAERLAAAQEAARQLYDTLRHTVKPDTVIVLPVVPCAPIKRHAPPAQAAAWTVLCQAFACLPTLAQCPVVVVPLGSVADGTPLAAALLGCHKMDLRLLAVAAKMGPLMQEAFEGIKQGLIEAARQQEAAQSAPPGASSNPAGQQAAPGARGSRGGAPAAAAAASTSASSSAAAAPAGAPAAVDPRKAERAERFKARGNDLFKVGKFAEAFTEYSRAINEHPENPIYYNNRAMACLKIFRFEQAEDDCNRALTHALAPADKAKALLRRATARTALQKYPEAERDLRQVLSVEPNNRQAREDLTHLQQMKAEMMQAQQRMAMDYQQQQQRAMAAAGGAAATGGPMGRGGMPPGAAGGRIPQLRMMGPDGSFPGLGLPPGLDPSMFPPGFDFAQLAQSPEALMQLFGEDGGEEQ